MKKEITIEVAKWFKKSYSKKMGGTQTILFPTGEKFEFDEREYYQGRGSKYNSDSMHDHLGLIEVSKKELSSYFKMMSEREKYMKSQQKQQKAKEKAFKEAHKIGVYPVNYNEQGLNYVELSTEESHGKFFNAEKLAKTLDISVEDAKLLNSKGKTYVFAKQKTSGKIIELYHASLDCNPIFISYDYPTEERIKKFESERQKWTNAPFANEVGQTENENHFVC